MGGYGEGAGAVGGSGLAVDLQAAFQVLVVDFIPSQCPLILSILRGRLYDESKQRPLKITGRGLVKEYKELFADTST